MEDETTQTVEIDLKNLFCYVLKHTKELLIVAVIFGIVGAGFSYIKQKKEMPTEPPTNVLDTSVMLPGESDEAYNNRVANVERANDIITNISALTKQVEIQNEYLSNSVYMQIDPLNTASSRVQIVITCDGGMVGGLDSLYNAYSLDITKGDYINSVAEELGYTPGAVQELIGVYLTSTGLTYADSQYQIGTLNIYVLGPSADETELIMDAIVAEVESVSKVYDSSIMNHTISVAGRQSIVGYDSGVKKNQLDSVTTLNTIQTQINNLNANLDNIAKTLGLADRTDFYESVIVATITNNSISIANCIQYGLVGLILGIVFAAGIIVLIYVFDRKIVSQSQFFSLLYTIESVGVCKPSGKRTKLQVMLDRMSNDDNALSEENTNKIISANYSNLTVRSKKILITGTIDSDAVREQIKKLGITGTVKLDMFSNPAILQTVSEYEGVVLVEKRGNSRKRMIREQIRLLNNSGTKILERLFFNFGGKHCLWKTPIIST